MNIDRIQQIQSMTAYPHSQSVANALCQVWNECEFEFKRRNKMPEVTPIKTTEQKIEDLLGTAKKELTSEATKSMVERIKNKLKQRQNAAKIVANLDREIDEMKLELAQELEAING